MNQHNDTQSDEEIMHSKEKEQDEKKREASPADDEETLDSLKAKTEEYLEGWKRAKADLMNFQRRTEERQKDLITTLQAGFIFSILPLYENFCAALTHIPDSAEKTFAEGLQHVKKQWDEWLASLGVARIDAQGQPFNLEQHEAIGRKKTGAAPSGVIIEVAQEGYTLHGKVLRPSKVVVEE